MIELGDRVRDKVTGFEGVVLAVTTCLYEATTCRVHPTQLKPNEGGIADNMWIPLGQLEPMPLEPRLTGFTVINGETK